MTDKEIIEKLGGVAAVARLVHVKSPAISYWLKKGIPQLRRIQLQVLAPEVFNENQTVQPSSEN